MGPSLEGAAGTPRGALARKSRPLRRVAAWQRAAAPGALEPRRDGRASGDGELEARLLGVPERHLDCNFSLDLACHTILGFSCSCPDADTAGRLRQKVCRARTTWSSRNCFEVGASARAPPSRPGQFRRVPRRARRCRPSGGFTSSGSSSASGSSSRSTYPPRCARASGVDPLAVASWSATGPPTPSSATTACPPRGNARASPSRYPRRRVLARAVPGGRGTPARGGARGGVTGRGGRASGDGGRGVCPRASSQV